MSKRNNVSFKFLLGITLVFFGSLACQKAGTPVAGDFSSHMNPFTDEFKENAGNLGGLDNFEQSAFGNTLDAMDSINPEFESILPDDLTQEVVDQLGNTSPDAMTQNAALINRLMQYCANAAVGLAPRPGEPLLGKYKGQCEKKRTTNTSQTRSLINSLGSALSSIPNVGQYVSIGTNFINSLLEIHDQNRSKPSYFNMEYTVSPKYETSLQNHNQPSRMQTENKGFAQPLPFGDVLLRAKGKYIDVTVAVPPSGTGTIVADQTDSSSKTTTVGTMKDTPYAATATVAQTQLGRSGKPSATISCPKVSLVESHNPIPIKAVEGFKQVANCMRPAMLLFSPAVHRFFDGLPPDVALYIKMGMLGIR